MSVLDVVDPVEIVEIIAWIIAAFGLIIIILASFDTFIRLNLFIIRHQITTRAVGPGRPREAHLRIIFGLDLIAATSF